MPPGDLGRSLRIKDFKMENEGGDMISFKQGTYNKSTGIASYTTMELPFFMEKLTKLHNASTNNALFFLKGISNNLFI